jgi:hypothetical protein
MVDVQFNREEVSFEHNGEEFIYSFHQFESGRITFKRLWTNGHTQESEVEIYPAGEKSIRMSVPVVLFKAHASGLEMNGILPNILTKLLGLYSSKAQFETDVKYAINFFPVKTLISTVKEVIEFVAPFAPWTVYFDGLS